MKQEESKSVTELMEYPPDTAGGLMTNRYVWIPRSFTVREAVAKLKVFAEITKHIYYFYVVDKDRRLIGFLSHRDLVLADSDDLVEDLMYQRVISVPPHMDQEEVASIFQKYDLLSVPVVDEQDHLAGIVTVDDVIDVMIEETNEDIGKFAASGKDIDFHTSSFSAAKRRLPWIILLLFLGMLSGSIISFFEGTLQKAVALSFFMPMIAGMRVIPAHSLSLSLSGVWLRTNLKKDSLPRPFSVN
ncbi:magnesium transporter [Paenibacillus larvae subsp. pulvifaciens]|uniref:Magnesium transporter MgtE n=1 Tax=Paenibacillus larvae subsp. pulvifaciens TaxID=1477 RepID=A0A1V0UNT2_9BACL|nr:magnesium transporter [Paenibacillus larvae]ARF66720.1 magnesium transporter [Paenibacillus larvae subsp. pulvifaciens]